MHEHTKFTLLFDLQVGAPDGGRYRVALDSDAADFGGTGRVGHGVDHFTEPEGVPGALFAPGLTVVVRRPSLLGKSHLRNLGRESEHTRTVFLATGMGGQPSD